MTRILLLEDHAFHSHFKHVFGPENVDYHPSVGSLLQGDIQGDWAVAFVDFSFGAHSPHTGLTAFQYLQAHHPGTRSVAFTSLGENSRNMFTVAAHRWGGMWGVLDKADTSERTLRRIAFGENRRRPGGNVAFGTRT